MHTIDPSLISLNTAGLNIIPNRMGNFMGTPARILPHDIDMDAPVDHGLHSNGELPGMPRQGRINVTAANGQPNNVDRAGGPLTHAPSVDTNFNNHDIYDDTYDHAQGLDYHEQDDDDEQEDDDDDTNDKDNEQDDDNNANDNDDEQDDDNDGEDNEIMQNLEDPTLGESGFNSQLIHSHIYRTGLRSITFRR